ncbi:MAG: 16S rRNA (cytosine(967)-C(5))-methyltransferase RsmB [Luteitalea sp.]|nr:16S rRNA (cytosine(967)-C(5))-methyltransferase RsmB [Luteitalea sp.]
MTAPARLAAWRALRLVHERGTDLPIALGRTRDGLPDARDRALATEIALGVLRWRAALDYLIARAGKRSVGAIDPSVLDVLRIGVYQLRHLTRVPAAVVVDEAVDMAKRARHPRAAGFVNALLRKIAATDEAGLPPAPSPEPPASAGRAGPWRRRAREHLSIALSHPTWLVERWLDRYGFEDAAKIARFNNGSAPVTLRANLLRTTAPALADALLTNGVRTQPGRYAPDALIVSAGQPLTTPLFREGACFVQDEASQVIGTLAAAACRAPVLDACAAPGGKTLALAAALGTVAASGPRIVAADSRRARMRLLRDTLDRAGAAAVTLVQLDLACGLPFREAFQSVLVDAPCSGLGTLRRDPDIRWKRTPDDLTRFASVQRAMLREAAEAVRPGGRLVYATCSGEPEENDEVVRGFLGERGGFALIDARTLSMPDSVGALVDARGFLRTLPHVHGLEAFFAAVILRKG